MANGVERGTRKSAKVEQETLGDIAEKHTEIIFLLNMNLIRHGRIQ